MTLQFVDANSANPTLHYVMTKH